MARDPTRAFTLADLIDYELQLALDNRVQSEERLKRDGNIRLDSEVLKQGKVAGLRLWLQKVRGPYGERFLQLRQLIHFSLLVLGALLAWGTVRGLLTYNGQHPVNVLPFLAIFFVLPLCFLLLLFLRGLLSRLMGRLPGGWVTASGHWLLVRVMKKNQVDLPVTDVWHRLKALHPRVFAWQAWILSQSFALAYYLVALGFFLFYLSVNDYAFAWQTTLRMGPDALLTLVQTIAMPFAWLGSAFVPTAELIQATQYDRFTARYMAAEGSGVAADWWPFLAAVMFFYGCLPRLLLFIFFKLRLERHLAALRFDDLASEELWLRLQDNGLGWDAAPGTQDVPEPPVPRALSAGQKQSLLVIRWRQAPFRDDELRAWFEARGHAVESLLDAEGRDSEFEPILSRLKQGQALALVCDPWELPGEAFNRLRLAMREKLPSQTPIFLVPLEHDRDASKVKAAEQDRSLWEASLKAFRDPYIGLMLEGSPSR
jgi:hypothetical protein